jgi:hypothetical protein
MACHLQFHVFCASTTVAQPLLNHEQPQPTGSGRTLLDCIADEQLVISRKRSLTRHSAGRIFADNATSVSASAMVIRGQADPDRRERQRPRTGSARQQDVGTTHHKVNAPETATAGRDRRRDLVQISRWRALTAPGERSAPSFFAPALRGWVLAASAWLWAAGTDQALTADLPAGPDAGHRAR